MTGIKPFIRFVVVLYMFTATSLCYGDSSELPSSQEEIEEVLKRLNKPHVKSIKMEPDYYPTSISVDDIKTSSMMNVSKDEHSSSSISQLWHSSGACPKGTIPIRRTTKEDVLRANSVKNYGKKKGYSIHRRQSLIDTELDDDNTRFGFATAYVKGKLYGTKATLNTWNPKTGLDNDQYSMSKIWIVGYMPDENNALEDINTIEAGWQVYPAMYRGDTNTRLFVFWTGDGYQETGCCDLDCAVFIQVNHKILLTDPISLTSETDGYQRGCTILIWNDKGSGNWYMDLNGEILGYWPSNLVPHLRDGATLIEWGGVVNTGSIGHYITQMGSGEFPQQGYRKASYIRNIQTVDASNTLTIPTNLETASKKGCYEISPGYESDSYWGTNIFFGGPGRNTNC
ncbi:protein neprosin-like isoform X1 [Bidens hawaiensis]|uniref:protein neprosin-like isoform X1 n=1 Tax=Bidens hawaiensis TaxID=980011 RepID=UPI00404ACEB3